MIAAGPGGVRAWTSHDLISWQGPKTIFRTPPRYLGRHPHRGHLGAGDALLPGQVLPLPHLQLAAQAPRAVAQLAAAGLARLAGPARGSSPGRSLQPFAHHATTPSDMMTLDGTFWVEDGVPYMVFCHEWVQITDGSIGVSRRSRRGPVGSGRRAEASGFRGNSGQMERAGERRRLGDRRPLPVHGQDRETLHDLVQPEPRARVRPGRPRFPIPASWPARGGSRMSRFSRTTAATA